MKQNIFVPSGFNKIYSNVYNFEQTDNGWSVETEDSQENVQNYIDSLVQEGSELYDADDFVPCARCGAISQINDCEGDYRGDSICNSCIESHYGYCKRCEQWYPVEDLQDVVTDIGETEEWCDSCARAHATRCNDCGTLTSDSCITTVANGDLICPNCIEENYSRCESCDEYYSNDQLDDNFLCPNCRCNGDIRSYHDNPIRQKQYLSDEKKTALLIGTEIETEKGDINTRVDITNKYGERERFIYQMHDGSLNADGIECITQPMSKKFFDKFNFEEWMKELVDAGARSHQTSNCGLHVHLSREWFWVNNNRETEDAIIGLVSLFFKNNETKIETFARRRGNHYCSYFSGDISSGKRYSINSAMAQKTFKKKIECLKGCNKTGYQNDRYDCVNTTNSNTVEFRVFRGTLNPETYRATVEFCIRVVEYAKFCYNNKKKEPAWGEFISFKKMAGVLDTYMIRRFGSEYKELFTEEY